MKKKQRPNYVFLFEKTMVVPNSELEIIEETKTADGNLKVAFKSTLQESNVKNGNNRVYSNKTCNTIVEHLSNKADQRRLLCEIDHPVFCAGTDNPQRLKQRAAVVEINNCGALIRNIRQDGNLVLGELETLSSFKGPDLANLIYRDKVDIGFSLRALGSVTPQRDGTLSVSENIIPITYDCVSNPSHCNARVMEFLPESDMSLFSNSDGFICENTEFPFLTEDNITLYEGGCCVERFLDDIIADEFLNTVTGMHFKF